MLDRLKQWLEGAPETLTVFPTYAHHDQDGSLRIPVHAWIFEKELESQTRSWLVRRLRSRLEFEDDSPEAERFRRRIWPFLADNERWKKLHVRVGEREFDLGRSGSDGHVKGTITIPADDIEPSTRTEDGRTYLEMTCRIDSDEHTQRVTVVAREGLSVVSDVDDTIKITNVLDRTELLLNTFVRPFQPVTQMAELYDEWAGPDTHFHYLSASPWQLLPFLMKFIEDHGFPDGSFHLRALRVKSVRSPAKFVRSSKPYKVATLTRVLDHFPARRFFLVGDSGEHDPEVYGEVAARHPQQIERIVIRRVEGADNTDQRFQLAFEQTDAAWELL